MENLIAAQLSTRALTIIVPARRGQARGLWPRVHSEGRCRASRRFVARLFRVRIVGR